MDTVRIFDAMIQTHKPTTVRFWPGTISATLGVTSDTVKASLKKAGMAHFSPDRDGYWELTTDGKEALAAAARRSAGRI